MSTQKLLRGYVMSLSKEAVSLFLRNPVKSLLGQLCTTFDFGLLRNVLSLLDKPPLGPFRYYTQLDSRQWTFRTLENILEHSGALLPLGLPCPTGRVRIGK